MKHSLCLVLAVGFLVFSVLPASALSAGQVAPDFIGKTLEGKEFRLSDLKGELILLKIGTTWCPSCRKQTVAIDSIYQYLAENKIKFVDVFVDESDTSVSKYFNKGGYQRPNVIILDEGAVHKAYNVYVIPRLILIDKDFNVIRDGDTLTARSLKKKIEKILGE